MAGLPKHKNNLIFLCYCMADFFAVAGLYIPYATIPQLVDVEGEQRGCMFDITKDHQKMMVDPIFISIALFSDTGGPQSSK